MFRTASALAVAAVTCAAALWIQTFLAEPARILVVEPDVRDLGIVGCGVHEATFQARNVSSQRVSISSAVTTCTCLGVDVRQGSLEPGESTDVICSWEVKEGNKGEVSNLVTLVYSQGGSSDLRTADLVMSARVEPVWTVAPSVVRFERETSAVARVQISKDGRHSSDWMISSAEVGHSSFEAAVLPSGREVEISYDATRPVLAADTLWLRVRTTSSVQPNVMVPISVFDPANKGE